MVNDAYKEQACVTIGVETACELCTCMYVSTVCARKDRWAVVSNGRTSKAHEYACQPSKDSMPQEAAEIEVSIPSGRRPTGCVAAFLFKLRGQYKDASKYA